MAVQSRYQVSRRQASERKRLKVLKTAGYCFAEKGFRRTTVEEVAKSSGVSKGLVFHFFDNKQALFKAVVEDGLNQWVTLSEYRASGVKGNSLDELRSLFLASFDFVEHNPIMLLFAREDEDLAKSYRMEFAKRNQRWRMRIEKTLKSGVARDELRDIDVRRVAVVFHQMQSSLLASANHGNPKSQFDRRTVEMAIDIFLRGVATSSSK